LTVETAAEALIESAPNGNVVNRTDPAVGKELRDELGELRSLRVGRFRIVYHVAARRVIDLVAIGPRR
jgi:mRNA-degrading endonuclease RelE of RelBE toxin-antitoxin system